jgi:hypothetical protein
MSTKPTARPVGKPTALTPEVQERIVTAVQAGSYLDDAASYAGIGYRSVFRWLERGRNAEAELSEGREIPENELIFWHFWQAIEKARADAAIRNVGIIQKAAQDGQWQAAAWYLERTNPRKWGRHETVEITGADGGAIQVEHSIKDALAEKFRAAEVAAMNVIEATVVEDEPKQLRQAK